MTPLETLRSQSPSLDILTAAEAQSAYASNTAGLERNFLGAARCRHLSEVQVVLKWAHQHQIPLSVLSTGKNWGYGCSLPVSPESFALDLSNMNRIRHFDASRGTVEVEPGVTQQALAEFLEAKQVDLMVPVTGAGPRVSILANALERGYGITPWTDHFQAILSLEAVLPDGSLYRSYGREMKCSLGEVGHKWGLGPYLDGLFCQSSWGVVTSMTIALARRPEICGSLVFEPKENVKVSDLVELVQSLLRDFPGSFGGINLMNQHRVLAMFSKFPTSEVDANGLLSSEGLATLAAQHQIQSWTGYATVYGTKPMTRALLKEVRKRLRPLCARVLFFTPDRIRWLLSIAQRTPFFPKSLISKMQAVQKSLNLVEGRPNQTALPLCYWKYNPHPQDEGRLDPSQDGCGLLWYSPLVPMEKAEVEKFVTWVEKKLIEFGREPLITLTSLSERCFDSTIPILFDRKSPEEINQAQACLQSLLNEGAALGFVPYRLGVNTMSWLQRQELSSSQLAEKIGRTLDPQRILMRGRYSSN